MSAKQLQTWCTGGSAEHNRDNYNYTQVIRVGDVLHLSGQGGWDVDKFEIPFDITEQIDRAFHNVEVQLTGAGSSGWGDVFRVNSYHISLSDEVQARMVYNFKKYMPDHKATWTCVAVTRLGAERMAVEIEVQAYAPKVAA
uniref:YjgF n=1 Tax=Tremella fuciformis TaxID=64657 RepID=D5KY50_9TREE|nr:YjgF [Tremella fuciformis]